MFPGVMQQVAPGKLLFVSKESVYLFASSESKDLILPPAQPQRSQENWPFERLGQQPT